MTRRDEAIQHFKDGYNCCKAIVSTYAGIFELNDQTRARMLAPYRALLGHPEDLCGAVAGAMRVLDIRLKGDPELEARKAEFLQRFEAQNGNSSCSQLLGCDLNTYEGTFKEIEENLCATQCVKYVADAVDILEDLVDFGD